MIGSIEGFLDWFAGVHQRTVRDLALLPAEAETWRPAPHEDPERSWGVPQLVRHIPEGRDFFVGAFLGHGWVWETWPDELRTRETWAPALARSMEEIRARLAGADPARLREKVSLIADPGRAVSGWRLLLMMAEHEIAHRSQIGAYAGLNGWPVAQIFDRSNEFVRAQRDDELLRHPRR